MKNPNVGIPVPASTQRRGVATLNFRPKMRVKCARIINSVLQQGNCQAFASVLLENEQTPSPTVKTPHAHTDTMQIPLEGCRIVGSIARSIVPTASLSDYYGRSFRLIVKHKRAGAPV